MVFRNSNMYKKNIICDEIDINIPNIYVNKTLLINNRENTFGIHLKLNKQKDVFEEANKIYEINGTYFREYHHNFDDSELVEFAIREELEGLINKSGEFSLASNMDLPKVEIGSSDTAHLTLTIQKAQNGVIINSNVFLTEQHWHTLMNVDEEAVQCAVCDIRCKVDEYQDHIRSGEHLKQMEMHLPLDKYDLCILRKIRNTHHCGVCNELIDVHELNDHFATKSHEDKLLYAVNRVSDIMYDLDIHSDNIEKEDCYHFNAKSINNKNRIEDNDQEDYEESCEGFYDYWPDKGNYEDYENQSTDECTSEIEEEFCNPCATSAGSYASMARKPRSLPKFLETEIGGKKVKVKFDSWHMILVPKPNRYYCMVCKTEDHIRLKPDHCTDDDHLVKLKECNIVEKYVGYLIRKVDHKLYHCAHCNNLQMICDIDDHIEIKHPKTKIKNITEDNGIAPSPMRINKIERSNSLTPTVSKNTNIVTKTVGNATDYNQNSLIIDTGPIDNEIKELNIFCNKFTLSLLSYNMVLCLNGYHCCACEFTFNADGISRHIKEVCHIEKLMQLPFIFEFNYNLIRSIRGGLHCAICNIPVAYALISLHIIDPVHVGLLNRAITLVPTTKSIKDPVEIPETSRNSSVEAQDDGNPFSILNQIDCNTPKNAKHTDNKTSVVSLEEKKETVIGKETAKSDLGRETKPDNEYNEDANEEYTENDPSEECSSLDTEEFVYLKLRNIFIKVTVASYNTLVQMGDGCRYCCLCSETLSFKKLGKHMESRGHMKSVGKHKFLQKYEKHLLRQVYQTYHCGLCNVFFSRRELNTHLSWSVHLQQIDCCHKIEKKNRRMEIKNGVKQIEIASQVETIYPIEIEPQIKIVANFEFASQAAQQEAVKKNKIVIFNDNALKISWDAWQGFCKTKTGYWCSLCQKDLKGYELSIHSNSSLHVQKLEKTFLKLYMPALVRRINETRLHCVTCNTEVVDKDYLVAKHITSKKHEKNYDAITQLSSEANAYDDCTENVFILQKP